MRAWHLCAGLRKRRQVFSRTWRVSKIRFNREREEPASAERKEPEEQTKADGGSSRQEQRGPAPATAATVDSLPSRRTSPSYGYSLPSRCNSRSAPSRYCSHRPKLWVR